MVLLCPKGRNPQGDGLITAFSKGRVQRACLPCKHQACLGRVWDVSVRSAFQKPKKFPEACQGYLHTHHDGSSLLQYVEQVGIWKSNFTLSGCSLDLASIDGGFAEPLDPATGCQKDTSDGLGGSCCIVRHENCYDRRDVKKRAVKMQAERLKRGRET